MKIYNYSTAIFFFLLIAFGSNAQKIKSEKVNSTYLKYPKVQVDGLQGMTFKAAKNGDFAFGAPVLKDTKSTCVPKGGGLKDVMELPTYYYEIPVKTPSMIVSVKNAQGEVIFAEEVIRQQDDHSLFGFDRCENWTKKTVEKSWASQSREFINNDSKARIDNAINEAQSRLKSDLFHELVNEEISVEWYKNKEYDYSELEQAAQFAMAGYELLGASYNSEHGKAKLGEAVEIWQQEIKGLNADDKKSRINKKVGMSIYTQLATALKYIEKYDEAAEAIKSARGLTSSNWSNNSTVAQEAMYQQIKERKLEADRFAGQAVVFAPESIDINIVEDTQYAELKSDLEMQASNEQGQQMAAQMAIFMEEKEQLDAAIASGEVNPYEHKIQFTSIQGHMLMLSNEDEFPVEITELTQLNQLFIQNGKVSSIPKEIASLENLKKLNLQNNQLTSLPVEIGELKNLKTLIIKGNNIPQSDIDAIQAKLPKCKIKS